MSKLQELIQKLCPDGVEYKKLGDFCEIKTGKGITKSDAVLGGIYPIISGGQSPMGYYHTFNREANTVTISRVGAYAGFVNYIKEQFYLNDKCFSVIPASERVSTLFLFYALKNMESKIKELQSEGGVPTINTTKVSNLEIPLPPFEIQEEVAQILDRFTNLAAELQAELQARKEQYEYYRNKLLMFDKIGGGTKSVTWVKMSEICEIGTGSSNTQDELSVGLYPFFVRSQTVRRKNEYEFDETAIITSGDGVGVGKIFHYVEGKYALHQRAYRLHVTHENLIPKFLFHYMRCNFYNYITQNAYTSSVTSIRKPMLLNFPVPIPSLEAQRHIVNILDKFEALTSDLSQGLPAEIAAIQEQYEYYRNKLLSFPRSKISA